MTRSGCPAAIAIGLTLLLITIEGLSLALAGADVSIPVFLPDTGNPAAPPMQGETWVGEDETWAIWLRPVDAEERLAYLARSTGLTTDPFASRPDEPPGFISFLLVIENRGEAGLSFNPLTCWLATNRKEIKTPLGLADLSFSYRIAGRELPVAYEKIRPALFESPRIVAPGERTSGLLVYRAIHPKTRKYRVDVELTLPSGDVAKLSAPYRRLKQKKKEDG